MRGAKWLAAVAVVVSIATGCGGGTPTLSADEEYDVASFNAAVASTNLDSSGYGALLDALPGIKALVRDKPDAVYETGAGESKTLRQVVADAASSLQPYQPDIADELDRTLATVE